MEVAILVKTRNQSKIKVKLGEIRKAEADEVKTMMLLNAIHENHRNDEMTDLKNKH
jgi:hypothetical protein